MTNTNTETQDPVKENARKGGGLVIINTGNGKGKTTAALGLLFRAWGNNMKVIMLQFVKKSTSNFGEHRAARKINVEIIARGAGFTMGGKNEAENKRLSLELWEDAKAMIKTRQYRMVILDEFTYVLKYGWIPVGEVIETLEHRPSGVHVVITGRDAPQELIDFADIVTEMKEVKHPLKKGVKAQEGIEF